MVPHLATALKGPINELEQRLLESMPAIERWFRLEWMEHTPAFYCAVDVRNAGYKLSPVETGLFPDGFNNLAAEVTPLAVQAAMAAIEKICPEAKNLLIIPEASSRKAVYHESLQRLITIFHQAGLHVRLGSLDPAVKSPVKLPLAEGGHLVLEPVLRQRGRLGLKDFDPCTILLNTPLNEGVPATLKSVHQQYLLPPLHAGAAVRRMSRHFATYEEVSKKFAKLLGMDPWLIHPMTVSCPDVDLRRPQDIERIRSQVDALLTKIRRKHKEYGIADKPFVVLKPGDDRRLLRTVRLRDAKEFDAVLMHSAEHGALHSMAVQVDEVLVQEGVPTFERINEAVAEPVVYMMDRYVVGGFYRVHAEAASEESLMTTGMSYVPLAFESGGPLTRPVQKAGASGPNRFYMYGVIARLAMLASSYELEATDPEADIED